MNTYIYKDSFITDDILPISSVKSWISKKDVNWREKYLIDTCLTT